ncbi:YhgE/Pip family protein [Microbacterium sp. zg.Y1090]|uniref:YhgE/Pip domain-containing protein n=1 Tax=Microbacterium TaxID=33882 RepID=UPI00214CFDA5|nr:MULTISPECIES: YhgE/Pip family protein [unclassified Microbacterium]MCR2812540.1 YhgE/Pip family protein [Microbacterium sp. zg.Y1084]MCR2817659.1 YhgE/Pip family protein [Microbacterium sp. zg.Y1090]MDL5485698.1 YhgE/Pip family protein [Microbacterium sp. zg-Y1211]WIM28867.1 YhgE/Pip family protein [Microbacterium sp. zg-Y1090]
MTLPLERARSRRPVTWLTLIGVLLLPVLIGGVLVAALYNPVERLDAMNVAVVNDDEPVTIDDQMVPLGRQLTAGLVEGSDELPSNLTWTISNDDDARDGLADGTYAAIVTIPENFSAAATSTAPGSTPEQATIVVETAPDSLIVDEAITAQVTQAAASLLGSELSQVYLENVFLGFTTLGDQLGEAADGAAELGDGARTIADGTTSLADGVRALGTGAGAIADGARELSSGAGQLAGGATQAANGLDTLAGGATTLADGQRQVAGALDGIAAQLPSEAQVPAQLTDALAGIGANSDAIIGQLTDSATQLAALAAACDPAATPQLCTQLEAASRQSQQLLPTLTTLVGQAGPIGGALQGLNDLPQLRAGLTEIAAQSGQIADGVAGLAGGAEQAAGGVRELGGGAGALATGASQLASGADQLTSGATDAADGADALADGIGELAGGADTLSEGLTTATDALPSYTDEEAADLASVVADPVAAEGLGNNLFGASAVPLLVTLALWFGGVASFVALRAVSARALTSRRPSVLLALRSLAPAAAIGAAQGLLVAIVVQLAADYDGGTWSLFALLCVLAGVAFAAVNQALIAVFGGAGRWIAALVGVLAVATGVVSTVPGVLASLAGLMPTTPAYQALLGALTDAGGVGAAVAGLIVWGALAFIASTLVVARRRSTSAKAIVAAAAV